METELQYEVTLDDIHAFNLHYARNAPHARRSRNSVRLVLTFILTALLCSLGFWSKAPLPFWLMGVLILGAWWAVFPSRLEQMLRRNTARMFGEGKNAGVLGPHRLAIDEDWVSERTEVREVRTHWKAVERIDEGQAHLYLYVASFSAVIVPKRAFASAEEARAFAARAEELRRAHEAAATPRA